MSRKDTIIIAVLVNAGLLIVLFSTALKPTVNPVAYTAPIVEAVVEPIAKQELPMTSGDEVDRVLQQYAQAIVHPEPSPVVSGFADDLRVFSAEAFATPLAQSPLKAIEPEAVESEAEFIEIKVKKGDMLEKLARYHQTTVSEIMTINQLNNTNLKIGQVLRIANKVKGRQIISQSPSHATLPASELKKEEGSPEYYTVQKGDNPWTIAVKNHLKVADLLKLNSLSEDQARRLKPGDQLRIR